MSLPPIAAQPPQPIAVVAPAWDPSGEWKKIFIGSAASAVNGIINFQAGYLCKSFFLEGHPEGILFSTTASLAGGCVLMNLFTERAEAETPPHPLRLIAGTVFTVASTILPQYWGLNTGGFSH